MKKQLQKKLYAVIVTAMMFSANANAQIVYTDVIPDSTMNCPGSNNCSKDYNLDLNNDANTDFIINVNYFAFTQNSGVSASPINGNAVKDTLISIYTLANPLQLNALIDSNLLLNQSWNTSGGCLSSSGTISCLWNNLSDYYLGLRLLQSGQTYYGWVRLRVNSSASVTIRDYAYNSIPNQAILAGQTTATGIIENSFASTINLFPNPATNHLTIALGSNNKKVQVTIADITGKIIYMTTANDTQKIEVNTKDFAEGIYVVRVQSADFIATKKLVVEK
jgi:Secretion system C-terminal sorting domain